MASAQLILKVQNLKVNRGNVISIDNISFTLDRDESLAIVGDAGSGKTSLGLAIAQKIFFQGSIQIDAAFQNKTEYISQQHSFKNRVNTSDLYYQQRFNSFDSEETLTVEEYIDEAAKIWIEKWDLQYILPKRLIQLSNGENKKLQLIKALSSDPMMLVLDQPFIGLDIESRKKLNNILLALKENKKCIIIITDKNEIPEVVDKVLVLHQGKSVFYGHKKDCHISNTLKEVNADAKIPPLIKTIESEFAYAVRFKNVNVTYGDSKLLTSLSWDVKKGERWLLRGPNGAGKSTLLSLIVGDNPQAYANDIVLFDIKRGSGESIWDIKRKIGFLSPELHVFYEKETTVFNAIGSGFYDSIGLFRKLNTEQKECIHNWIEFFNISDIANKYLYEISLGWQRFVLLLRALLKNPPLLIMDEPCQGLDHRFKSKVIDLINNFALQNDTTLIYVSHYIDEKPSCIDHEIVLEEGKAIFIY